MTRGHPRGARRRSRRRPARRRSTPSAIASAARCSRSRSRYMAATGDERIASATFLTAQIDFEYAGDLKVFADADHIASVEAEMKKTGYLEGSKMATAFNLLRSNDLIWPYVVNDYLKGKEPLPFDLLYWNADATRMPCGEPLVLPAQLLSGEQPLHAAASTIAGTQGRPLQGHGAGLQPRHPRGSHRAGEIGLRRLGLPRRAGALRADRLRPHRRRGQSAGAARNTNTGPAARRRGRWKTG